MARCDFATWNPAGATPGGKIDPRVVIFHVTAGLGNAKPHNGLEWHFEVSLSGALEQQVDTNLSAAANYKANPFAISVETEGKGEGFWTDAQLDMLVRLSEWCLAIHPKITRQRCPTWDGSGFGYHIMFGTPGKWTPVAKACPGPNRIKQFDDVLLPRILAGSPAPAPEPEDDMRRPIIYVRDNDKRWPELYPGGQPMHFLTDGTPAGSFRVLNENQRARFAALKQWDGTFSPESSHFIYEVLTDNGEAPENLERFGLTGKPTGK